MDTKSEVIGWLILDDAARVLVRKENGRISRQTVNRQSTFEHHAIQTGSFGRYSPVVDPVTHETLGYEVAL